MQAKQPPFSSLLSLLHLTLIFSFFAKPSSCGPDSVIYCGCTQLKFNPGTPYESNLNSVLISIVNSSASTNYNNFKVSHSSSSKQNDTVYGLFQCRGDLSNSDCQSCVASAVNQLGNTCGEAIGGGVQLDGCFVRYDNISFVGFEDKKVVKDECGSLIGSDSDTMSRREAVLTSLTNQGQYFRVAGSGNVQGVAQCTQDLSLSKCQDCLSTAIGQLRSECGTSSKGDMFLAKCYARFSELGFPTKTDNSGKNDNHDNDGDDDDDDVQRTLAIAVAVIVVVALLVLFISMWSRHLDRKYGK